MGRTKDSAPGPSHEEETLYDDRTADGDPTVDGAVRRLGDTLLFKTSTVVVDLTAGGSGISEGAHKTLRQLIHFIDEGPAEGFVSGAFKEIVGGLFPTSVIWYDDATKAKKLVEKVIARSGGGATNLKPTPIVWKVYDTDGSTVLATVSDAIAYSGVLEVSRVRTIS